MGESPNVFILGAPISLSELGIAPEGLSDIRADLWLFSALISDSSSVEQDPVRGASAIVTRYFIQLFYV